MQMPLRDEKFFYLLIIKYSMRRQSVFTIDTRLFQLHLWVQKFIFTLDADFTFATLTAEWLGSNLVNFHELEN